ncbi:hypothetical protein ASF66_12105 [Pseudomonas sp. Leaf129]|nr:hypothetical protein ASF66_12105 [Pseudomonas sp. Leaf129]
MVEPSRWGAGSDHASADRYRLQEWLSFQQSKICKGYIALLYSTLVGQYLDTAKPKLERRLCLPLDLSFSMAGSARTCKASP